MNRSTALAEAFVNATAKAINEKGKAAPWMARRVAERVTNTDVGTIKEPDIAVHATYKTRQRIKETCGVRV